MISDSKAEHGGGTRWRKAAFLMVVRDRDRYKKMQTERGKESWQEGKELGTRIHLGHPNGPSSPARLRLPTAH